MDRCGSPRANGVKEHNLIVSSVQQMPEATTWAGQHLDIEAHKRDLDTGCALRSILMSERDR